MNIKTILGGIIVITLLAFFITKYMTSEAKWFHTKPAIKYTTPSDAQYLTKCTYNSQSCPQGYRCFDTRGPLTFFALENQGWDRLCRKECTSDADCPTVSPVCMERTYDDGTDYPASYKLCLSVETAEIIKNEEIQKLAQQREAKYESCLKFDDKYYQNSSAQYGETNITLYIGLRRGGTSTPSLIAKKYGLTLLSQRGNSTNRWTSFKTAVPIINRSEIVCTMNAKDSDISSVMYSNRFGLQ